MALADMNGSGTVDDPYQVETLSDLDSIREDPTAAYALQNDIDASSTETLNGGNGWVPIGLNPGGSENNFTGAINGNGYTIDGLHSTPGQTSDSGRGAGLIYQGASGFQVIDLKLANVVIDAGNYSGGGLMTYTNGDGEITNVHVTGQVHAPGSYAGGIIAYPTMDGKVQNCTFEGKNDSGADIIAQLGGGGIAGEVYADDGIMEIEGCDVVADIETSEWGGGIAGAFSGHRVRNCTFEGTVLATSNGAGGIIGSLSGGASNGFSGTYTIDDCHSVADITGGSNVGGVCGTMYTDLNVRNVSSEGLIKGNSPTGGVAGSCTLNGSEGLLTARHTGNVVQNDETTSYSRAGGLIGRLNSGIAKISACYHSGDVVFPNSTEVGGMVGQAVANAPMTDSYHVGKVEGDDNVGGLVGESRYAFNIQKSYTASNVVYNTNGGTIYGGHGEDADTISDVYYDSDLASDGGLLTEGTGLSTAEMTGSSAESNMALDFTDVWRTGSEYPELQYEPLSIVDVTGKITDAAGDPIEGDVVAVGSNTYETDANGEFTFQAPAGEEVEVAALMGDYVETYTFDTSTSFTIAYPGLKVIVRHPVTDEPLERVAVQVGDYTYATDQNGEVDINLLPIGDYKVTALDYWEDEAKLQTEGIKPEIVFDGTERTVTVNLSVVDDREGVPVDDVDVMLEQSGAQNRTDETGKCTVFGEVRGPERMLAAADDPRYHTIQKTLGTEQEEFDFELTLRRREPGGY